MCTVRTHSSHRSREGNGRLSHRAECHRKECDGDLFSCCHEHIHLARILVGALHYLASKRDEIIRRVTHGRYYHDNAIIGGFFAQDSLCYIFDFFRCCNGTSTKFLNN